MVFGLLTIAAAAGWRRALTPGRGATIYPPLRVVEGLGLVVVGIFSQDPMPGYPPGAAVSAPTLHSEIHLIMSYVSFTSLIATVILAWRFWSERGWRGWAWPTALFGLMPIVFIAAFGATYGHSPSGVFERLASSGGLPLGFAILGRLLAQAWRSTRRGSI